MSYIFNFIYFADRDAVSTVSSTASVSSAASAAGLQKRPTFEALDKRKSWTNAAEQQAREQAGVRAVAAASSDWIIHTTKTHN